MSNFSVTRRPLTGNGPFVRTPLRTEGILRGMYNVARGIAGKSDTQPEGSVGHAVGSWFRHKLGGTRLGTAAMQRDRFQSDREAAHSQGAGSLFDKLARQRAKTGVAKQFGADTSGMVDPATAAAQLSAKKSADKAVSRAGAYAHRPTGQSTGQTVLPPMTKPAPAPAQAPAQAATPAPPSPPPAPTQPVLPPGFSTSAPRAVKKGAAKAAAKGAKKKPAVAGVGVTQAPAPVPATAAQPAKVP